MKKILILNLMLFICFCFFTVNSFCTNYYFYYNKIFQDSLYHCNDYQNLNFVSNSGSTDTTHFTEYFGEIPSVDGGPFKGTVNEDLAYQISFYNLYAGYNFTTKNVTFYFGWFKFPLDQKGKLYPSYNIVFYTTRDHNYQHETPYYQVYVVCLDNNNNKVKAFQNTISSYK